MMLTDSIPRVTPVDLDNSIKSEAYFFDGTMTICVLTMQNGFKVTGESACAHPDLFNEEIGKTLAKTQAKNKIWPLLGYVLREQLYLKDREIVEGFDGWVARLNKESEELSERYLKLDTFLSSPSANTLAAYDKKDLQDQRLAMERYLAILKLRLKRLGY